MGAGNKMDVPSLFFGFNPMMKPEREYSILRQKAIKPEEVSHMLYGATAVIMLYYSVFLLYYRKLYPPSTKRYLPAGVSLLCIIVVYATQHSHGYYWTFFAAVTLALILGIRFSTAMSTLQAVYGGLMSTISGYCFRGILTGLYLLAFHNGEPDVLKNPDIYYGITMAALPVSLLYFVVIRRTILPDARIMRVLSNPEQTGPIVGYQITAVILLMLLNQGRFTSTDINWYIEVALIACIISLGMLIYAVFRAGEFMESQEYKWRSKLLEEQYATQLRHYHVVEKYTGEMRRFRHDFRAASSALMALLESEDIVKAKKLLEEMQATVQSMTNMRRRYSDHVVLDAMLQDLAAQCDENQIRFTFQAVAPTSTQLSLLDAIRIFHNLTANAVEACKRMPAENRFIEITTTNADGWTTLHILNAYDGQLRADGKTLLSIKQDRENHGMGVSSVKAIAEKMGGFLQFEANQESGTFSMRVHIPSNKA